MDSSFFLIHWIYSSATVNSAFNNSSICRACDSASAMPCCSSCHWRHLTSSEALLSVCRLTCIRTLRGKSCDMWMHISGGLFLWERQAFPVFRHPGTLLTWMDVKPHSCDLHPSHRVRILAPELQKPGLHCQFSGENASLIRAKAEIAHFFAPVWMISFLGHTFIVHGVLQVPLSLGEVLQPSSSLVLSTVLSSFSSPCRTPQWSLRSDLTNWYCQLLWNCPSPLSVAFVFTVFDGPDNYLSFLSILAILWRDFISILCNISGCFGTGFQDVKFTAVNKANDLWWTVSFSHGYYSESLAMTTVIFLQRLTAKHFGIAVLYTLGPRTQLLKAVLQSKRIYIYILGLLRPSSLHHNYSDICNATQLT